MNAPVNVSPSPVIVLVISESTEPSLAPFVKAVNGSYIVQLGSFSEKDRANALVSKLRAKGYNPKVNYEN